MLNNTIATSLIITELKHAHVRLQYIYIFIKLKSISINRQAE